MNEGSTCDLLWLPACPACSWIALWRDARLDRLEYPSFHYARNTSAKYGRSYFLLSGCPHSTNLGLRLGPRQNRLKISTAWRRYSAELFDGLWRVGFTEAQRAIVMRRLGHPSEFDPEEEPEARAKSHPGENPFAVASRAIRKPYAED